MKSLPAGEKQKTLLLIVRCWLALGDYESATAEYLEIEDDMEVKSEAKISLAVSMIRNNPKMALQLLAGVPIFSLRMRGVKECADELLSDKLAGKRAAALDILSELTLMAVADEKCADMLIAKWVGLSNDRKAITESLTKIGYPIKDVLTGQLNEPALGQD